MAVEAEVMAEEVMAAAAHISAVAGMAAGVHISAAPASAERISVAPASAAGLAYRALPRGPVSAVTARLRSTAVRAGPLAAVQR
jgi:hypothetical protein